MENTDSDTRVANSDEPDVFSFKPATYGGSRLVGFTLSDREDLFYNMNHKKRGLAVIFNHHSFDVSKLNPRSGTEVDAENLKNTLTKLGFEVIVHKDLRKKMVQEEIRRGTNK